MPGSIVLQAHAASTHDNGSGDPHASDTTPENDPFDSPEETDAKLCFLPASVDLEDRKIAFRANLERAEIDGVRGTEPHGKTAPRFGDYFRDPLRQHRSTRRSVQASRPISSSSGSSFEGLTLRISRGGSERLCRRQLHETRFGNRSRSYPFRWSSRNLAVAGGRIVYGRSLAKGQGHLGEMDIRAKRSLIDTAGVLYFQNVTAAEIQCQDRAGGI